MHEHTDIDQPNGSADLSRINGTPGPHGEPDLEPGLQALCAASAPPELELDLQALCAASAPGVFAICETGDPLDDTVDFGDPGSQETGDTEDGRQPPRILAWGLDFGERAILTGCDGNYVARLSSPGAAQRRLYRHSDTRLIRFRTA